MKKIKLTKGRYALVDKSNFEMLSQHKWFFDFNGYPMTNIKVNGNWKKKRMHHFIMEKRKVKS